MGVSVRCSFGPVIMMLFMLFADDTVFEMCCIVQVSEIPAAFIPKPKV